jgi:hypothetical protein
VCLVLWFRCVLCSWAKDSGSAELQPFVEALTLPPPTTTASTDSKSASDAADTKPTPLSAAAATTTLQLHPSPPPHLLSRFLSHPLVTAEVSRDFHATALSHRLPPTHVPRALHLTLTRFSAENGLLTPSLKVCRPALRKQFGAELKALYQSSDPIEQKVNSIVRAVAALCGLPAQEQKQKWSQSGGGAEAVDVHKSLSEMGITSIETIRLVSAVKDQLQVELPLGMLAPTHRCLPLTNPPSPFAHFICIVLLCFVVRSCVPARLQAL